MTETPRKLVHWEFSSPSLSGLNSPFFNATYESSIDSTSSLEFINAQLVAHGFVPSPGLSLDGISNDNSARVVKCLLALLGQRVEDMKRTEELTTKLRTLSYDHERMVSMYRKATEQSANAEREMNLHKSRLATAVKSLQASENAHKQTSAELQRTRTSLQGIRATHHAEIKKKEKEVERVLEKWQKISDAQTKLSSTSSGMRCANVAVVEGTEVLGKGQGFLEIALEQAEQARSSLNDENLLLRKLVLRTINEVQSILHHAKCLLPGDQSPEEPVPFTLTTLFPLAPPNAASESLDSILSKLRENLTEIFKSSSTPTTNNPSPQIPDGEIERLQGAITALKDELAHTQKQNTARLTDTQTMFDKFAEDHRIATGEIGEMSIELMSAPLKDEARERLDILRKELDLERQKFTEAAIRFGKEKASLEAERFKFLDEKRAWQVEQMLADLSPTPAPALSNKPPTETLRLTPKKSPHKPPHKSPHKLPRRSPARNIAVGKAGSGRKAHRVSRISLSPLKMVVSYETEFMPPIPAPSFPSIPSMKSLAPPPTSLLPTSFVLPPPSPRASLPTKPALPPALPNSPPQSTTPESSSSSGESADSSPPSSSDSSGSTRLSAQSTPPPPRRPFPVAKPFAQRMIHAYSPAKPSPLSRILMLGDSPMSPQLNMMLSDFEDSLSPMSGPLDPVMEEPDDGGLGYGNTLFPPGAAQAPEPREEPQMSLAAQLGVESPPDTPLQEKKVEPNVAPVLGRGRVFHPDPEAAKKPYTAAEKGKARAETVPRARTSAVGEKENSNAKAKGRNLSGKSGKVSPAGLAETMTGRKVSPTTTTATAGAPTKTSIKAVVKASTASSAAGATRAKMSTKPGPPIAGTGPRRVPINSADAPPIGKGWKG